jgi:hypothetical protein
MGYNLFQCGFLFNNWKWGKQQFLSESLLGCIDTGCVCEKLRNEKENKIKVEM